MVKGRYVCQFFNQRLRDIKEELLKCPKYLDLQNEIILIQKSIIDKLPKDSQALVLDYEELEVASARIAERFIYKKGLMDGIRVANLCRKIKRF